MSEDGSAPDDKVPAARISVSLETLRREIENAILKLHISLADSFAAKADLARTEGDLRMLAEAANKRMEQMDTKIEELEQDKAGREAVTQWKRWLTGGAVLGTIFMAIQVAISFYLVTHAHAH